MLSAVLSAYVYRYVAYIANNDAVGSGLASMIKSNLKFTRIYTADVKAEDNFRKKNWRDKILKASVLLQMTHGPRREKTCLRDFVQSDSPTD